MTRTWCLTSTGVFLSLLLLLLNGCGSSSSPTLQSAPRQPKSLTIAPLRAAITVNRTLSVTVTTDDPSGVIWTTTGGTLSAPTSASGTAVIYTPTSTAGVYTITATSVTNSSLSASTTVAVTDLAGVFTYHNNLVRDGTNQQEYALTPANVNATTFGKLFSCPVDGAIYAQPLWVPDLNIGGSKHNVIIAASMRDSVYAFDADASPCVTYWNKTLIPPGETYGSQLDFGTYDIIPDIGILGTPVIDGATGTIYLVTKSKTGAGTYHQRLHALNLADGSERTNSPAEIDNSVTVPGTCAGSSTVAFDPKKENQRSALALVNGVVYVAWASHGDEDPYFGWVAGYDASRLNRVAVYNTAPNALTGFAYCRAGIWMSGAAPAFDSSNNMYLITGNGLFDGISDFGDSFLKLSTVSGLSRIDSFTPYDQADLDRGDMDVGSGGAVVLVDLPATAAVQHLMVGGGKGEGFAGKLYVLNRDALGGYQQGTAGGDSVVQEFSFNYSIFSTPAIWQNTLYVNGVGGPLEAFALNTATGRFNTTPVSQSVATLGFPGATPSLSSSGTTNGIVWLIDSNKFGTTNSAVRPAGPAVLHAFDAANLATELWNSSMVAADQAGNAVKFTVPTVANGRVYIGTRGNDDSWNGGTTLGEIDVYGLKPN